MNLVRNVYEYGREGQYLCLLRYTYGGIRIINIQVETKLKTRSACLENLRVLLWRNTFFFGHQGWPLYVCNRG